MTMLELVGAVGLLVLGGVLTVVGGSVQTVLGDRKGAKVAAILIYDELELHRAHLRAVLAMGEFLSPHLSRSAFESAFPALLRTRAGRGAADPVSRAYRNLHLLEERLKEQRHAGQELSAPEDLLREAEGDCFGALGALVGVNHKLPIQNPTPPPGGEAVY